jgi:ABC-type Fe3+-hydroxamate transport system substrate-binding protein
MIGAGFRDQIGKTVTLTHFPPRRIVSLVPSQTELLFDLNLEKEVAGITKFCVHPASMFNIKPRVGGTKTVDLSRVRKLSPDLIIANREENVKEQVEALAEEFPVWTSDIKNLGDSLEMIKSLGRLTGREQKALEIAEGIRTGFSDFRLWLDAREKRSGLKVAYFIWRKPWMSTGVDTFIHTMLAECGFTNVFSHLDRYPEITPGMLKEADPDLILLSSEPYPFSEKHFAEFHETCTDAEIRLVDGEIFSWYGSRLLKAPEYFKKLLSEIRPA